MDRPHDLRREPPPDRPPPERGPRAARPFQLMAKPGGAACNLACDYCYYLDKEALYPGRPLRMSDATLEAYVRQTIEAQPGPDVAFAWQGGEPTLMGLPFFERAFALQRRYRRPGQRIHNALQTNATLLDDAWGAFLRRHDVLVGVSLDGPRELHDRYRTDQSGHGSFGRVMRGVETLRRHRVAFNVLATVHHGNQDRPLEVYRFVRDELRARHLQLIPIVERPGDGPPHQVTDRTVDARAYGEFLVAIFDAWVRRDVGRMFVQMFDVTLGAYLGRPGGLCVFDETCGRALAVEHDGDVYACDHYVRPDHRLGNLTEAPLVDLVDGEAQRRFGDAKRDTLPAACRTCDVRWLCHGGCPKDRLVPTSEVAAPLNHLCAGYRRFFTHTGPAMRFMADAVRAGRPPSSVMAWAAHAAVATDSAHRGRPNAPCACGSGRKTKHCCGRPRRVAGPSRPVR